MKVEKLSLKGIKNVLSRAELKRIMAGSSGGGGGGGGGCPIPCAPNCNTLVELSCRNSSGILGNVDGYTCNKEGQIQECYQAGYTTTTFVVSDCTC
jgi:hypothetical protein